MFLTHGPPVFSILGEVTLALPYDGIYVDNWHANFPNTWANSIARLTNGSFDSNGDGLPDSIASLQAQYAAWKPYYSARLRALLGPRLLYANVDTWDVG